MFSQGNIFANGNSFMGNGGMPMAGILFNGERLVAEAKCYKWLGPISPGALS